MAAPDQAMARQREGPVEFFFIKKIIISRSTEGVSSFFLLSFLSGKKQGQKRKDRQLTLKP